MKPGYFGGREEKQRDQKPGAWRDPRVLPGPSLPCWRTGTDTGMSSTFQTPAVSFLGGRSQLETCKMCLFQRTHPETSESHILH